MKGIAGMKEEDEGAEAVQRRGDGARNTRRAASVREAGGETGAAGSGEGASCPSWTSSVLTGSPLQTADGAWPREPDVTQICRRGSNGAKGVRGWDQKGQRCIS